MRIDDFDKLYLKLLQTLRDEGEKVPMGSWQSQSTDGRPGMSYSIELRHVQFRLSVPGDEEALQNLVRPNLPWAEDHFLERVSGKPLNPPPSEAWWPYRVQQNAEHKHGERFSHTYPERMWPKHAGRFFDGFGEDVPGYGIRYNLGDLDDLVNQLVRDPLTRQAYLPIWFPEDTGAVQGQRVPCTLGYRFLGRPRADGAIYYDITYDIRSCDLFRHFTDDVYMACRLLQWVVGKAREQGIDARPSLLIMNISSLHLFEGDEFRLKQMTKDTEEEFYGAAV